MKNIKKNIIACMLLLLLLPTAANAGVRTENARRAYIEAHKDLALLVERYYGVPASICMAQALLETDSGRSLLCEKAKNHFGMKVGSKGWSGPSMKKIDDKVDKYGMPVPSNFRMYGSSAASFSDYGRMLSKSTRFAPLFQIDRSDYAMWAVMLYKKGYATNPEYAELLIRIIKRYELYNLSKEDFYLKPLVESVELNTKIDALDLKNTMEDESEESSQDLPVLMQSAGKQNAKILGDVFMLVLLGFFIASGIEMYQKSQFKIHQKRLVNRR